MSLPVIGKAIESVEGILDKFIEDKGERRKRAEEMVTSVMAIAQEGEAQQNAINLEQAKSDSLFIAGPRPFVMWGSAICFFYGLGGIPLSQNLLEVFFPLLGQEVPTLTQMDTSQISPLLMGLLGLGGYRTFEKYNGVARESLSLAPRKNGLLKRVFGRKNKGEK